MLTTDCCRSNRHHANFFFHLNRVHHHDRVPRTAVEEASVRAFAEALLASDTKNRVDLDSAEWWMVFVRNPEHAIFHGAIFHAGRRTRAPGAALGNDRQLLWFLLARRQEPFGFGFEFELVGHHPGGFQGVRFSSHGTDYTAWSEISLQHIRICG